MAWYSNATVHYRGRLVEVSLRYGCYQGARVVRGKSLTFPHDGDRRCDRRVIFQIMNLVQRQDAGALEAPEY